jgi:RNA polymerase sigma-70 factor (ECF subfamily)
MTRVSLRKLLRIAWVDRAHDWWRFAASLTKNHADAEDLVDEAILRTLRTKPRLRDEKEVHAYLLTAIRNTWFKWTRARRRRYAVIEKLPPQPEGYSSGALQNLIDAERDDRLEEALGSALQKMEPEIRAAIGLYVLRDPGLTLREIAEAQGTSISTAHSRVQRALRMLASELREFNQ